MAVNESRGRRLGIKTCRCAAAIFDPILGNKPPDFDFYRGECPAIRSSRGESYYVFASAGVSPQTEKDSRDAEPKSTIGHYRTLPRVGTRRTIVWRESWAARTATAMA